MNQRIAQFAVTVRDYDEALAFYVGKLGFECVEDTPLGDGKRWLRVRPRGSLGAGILLARAASERQAASVGNQTGGRVFIFVETDDCRRDFELLTSRGVTFVRPPADESYGTVAVFADLYGNQFDLIGPNRREVGSQKTVLLVIDLLNDFLNSWEPAKRAALIQATNALVRIARSAGVPVVWVRQEFDASLADAFAEMRQKQIAICIKGTRGCELFEGLERESSDRILVKKRYSAFFRTELDALLETQGASRVILAGINSHACIRTTAIDAYQRDLQVILATDCISSYDPAHHDISMRYMTDKLALALDNEAIHELLARQ